MLAINRHETMYWCDKTESFQNESGPFCDVCAFNERYHEWEGAFKEWPQYSDRDLCCEGCGINFITCKFPVEVGPDKLAKLREQTGLDLQTCSKALEICENGFDDAVEWLRKAGQA